MEYRIRTLNKISEHGLRLFDDGYKVGSQIADPHALVVRSAEVDTDVYQNLIAVARAGAGVNNISIERATEKGICVFNTPGANANAVAELVFIVLGMYARRVDKAIAFTQRLKGQDAETIVSAVESSKSQFTGFELAGKTLGVIGLGKIGVLVANAGGERGMRVVGYDAFPTLTNMHQLSSKVALVRRMEDVLTQADVLSVHVPLNDKTRNLIDAAAITLLKTDCVLMNYAREGICNDEAVLMALDEGRLEAYITDFPAASLLDRNGVLCTPHLGASTNESEEKCAEMAVNQIKDYLQYGVVRNSVNFPVVEDFPRPTARARLAVVNQDIPGMIEGVTRIIREAGINIQHFKNESNGRIGYSLVDVEADISQEVVQRIQALEGILRVRVLRFGS